MRDSLQVRPAVVAAVISGILSCSVFGGAALLSGCGDSSLPPSAGGPHPDLAAPVPDMGCTGGCIDDRDCFGFHCDRRSTVCGLCVACLIDQHCPGGQLCDARLEVCRAGCGAGHPCGSDGGTCEVDAGVCVGCLGDGDCHDPARPRCDAGMERCVACLPDKDNCVAGKRCARIAGDYQCTDGCKSDADCGAQMHCLPATSQCVSCLMDAECPAGKICSAHQCASGCTVAHACQMGNTCCQSHCADLMADTKSCGGCGLACNGGWNCCGGACRNPDNDWNNCGGCGVVCKVSHGAPGCAFGKCVIAACDAGWSDCNNMIADGCESNTDIDLKNCGGCGQPCALNNAFSVCKAGNCSIGACYGNFADCDGNTVNGCEAALKQDPKNCGACGVVCPMGQACVGGGCL